MLVIWPYLLLQGNCVLPHKQYSSFLTTVLQLISSLRWDSLEAKKSELLRFSRQACFLGLKILLLLSGTTWKPKNLSFSDLIAKSVTRILTYFETFIFSWTELEFYSNVFIVSLFSLINIGCYVNDYWCLFLLLCCVACFKQFINCETWSLPWYTECNLP